MTAMMAWRDALRVARLDGYLHDTPKVRRQVSVCKNEKRRRLHAGGE
jgi:hypothetical protein